MYKASVVIPNYNGEKYIDECMNALRKQREQNFEVILVDNASEDNSIAAFEAYNDLNIRTIILDENYGFSRAVNEGIKASEAEYVILLNNDTHVGKKFVGALVDAMDEDDNIFSAQAHMLQYSDRTITDSAGDYFCALGWGFSRGKDEKASKFTERRDVFSSCAGAAIYRKSVFETIGYFDEVFFAYLEDMDIGYRAKLHGYRNVFVPEAKVLHVGSGSSGSRYNEFKTKLAARNSMLVMYKNFAGWQFFVNIPFIFAGIILKSAFFAKQKLLKAYLKGILEAFVTAGKVERQKSCDIKKNYGTIQRELMKNVLIRTGVKE